MVRTIRERDGAPNSVQWRYLFVAAPVLLIFTGLGVSSLAPWQFVAFEGLLGAALGLVLTPLIVWRAIVDRSSEAP